MVSISTAKEMALAFPETDEHQHFDKPAFRVRSKIFATVHLKDRIVVVKLTPEDQSVFCRFDNTVIYPVAGAWGRQGWTMIELKKVRKEMFRDALTVAYCTVAPQQLAEQFLPGKGNPDQF